MRWYFALVDRARYAVVLTACALVTVAAVKYVEAKHEARQAREKICDAELRALRARNPFIERFVQPADKCLALEVVRAGQ